MNSISLAVAGSNATSFSTTAGTGKTITPTVTDILGNTITWGSAYLEFL